MHKKQGAVSNPKCNGLINRGKLSLSHLYQNFRVSLQMHSESLHFIGVLLVLQYIQGVPNMGYEILGSQVGRNRSL